MHLSLVALAAPAILSLVALLAGIALLISGDSGAPRSYLTIPPLPDGPEIPPIPVPVPPSAPEPVDELDPLWDWRAHAEEQIAGLETWTVDTHEMAVA